MFDHRKEKSKTPPKRFAMRPLDWLLLIVIIFILGIAIGMLITSNLANATNSLDYSVDTQSDDIVVNTTNDTVRNDGACTLREAITSANTDTASGSAVGECHAGNGADTIILMANGVYRITSSLPDAVTDITILGNGRTVDGGGGDYHLISGNEVPNTLVIDNLRVQNFNTDVIHNNGQIAIHILNSHFVNITPRGSWILGGMREVHNTTIINNTFSGGIAIGGEGIVISDVTITGKGYRGICMFSGGSVTITNVTISGMSSEAIATCTDEPTTFTIRNANLQHNAIGVLVHSGSIADIRESTIYNNYENCIGEGEFTGDGSNTTNDPDCP